MSLLELQRAFTWYRLQRAAHRVIARAGVLIGGAGAGVGAGAGADAGGGGGHLRESWVMVPERRAPPPWSGEGCETPRLTSGRIQKTIEQARGK